MILSLALVYVVSLVLRAWLAVRYASSIPQSSGQVLPANTLTFAQAILSGDPLLESRLETNLSTFADQKFLWLIDEDDEEARRIAGAIQTTSVEIILCAPCPNGINPKLWKLQLAAQFAHTPYFCVLDDDTTLSPESAAALVMAAEKSTVATGLPFYLDSNDLASGLLAQFVNNNSVFTYLGTSCLLPAFTLNGMGYVMRWEELTRIDHFKPIIHELTDDLALATLVVKRGGSIHQSTSPLRVRTGVKNVPHYMQLMHRWYVFTLLLVRRQSVPVQILIFMLHGLPPMVLVALFVLHDVRVICVVLVIRYFILHRMHTRFFGMKLQRPLLSVLSELMQPVHLVHSLIVRTVRWRTRRYWVQDTDKFNEI